MSDTIAVNIEANSQTEQLIQMIIDEFKETGMTEDEALDAIEVERIHGPEGGVMNEPITVAATLIFGTTLVIAVSRAVEKWIEKNNQKITLKILIDAVKQEVAVAPLVELSMKYADVSISNEKLLKPQQGNQILKQN